MKPFEKFINLERSIKGKKDKPKNTPFGYMGMPEGGRGLDEYEQKMMFNRKDLVGKNILDLGSGPSAKFSKDLKTAGINANVFSISPQYATPAALREIMSSREATSSLAGEVSATPGKESFLPFRDESFDVEFAFHVDEHVDKQTSLKIITEMARTLKPGGYAKYGPVYDIPNQRNLYKTITSTTDIYENLKHFAVQVSIENVPLEIISRQKIKDEDGNAFYVPAHYIVLHKKEKNLFIKK